MNSENPTFSDKHLVRFCLTQNLESKEEQSGVLTQKGGFCIPSRDLPPLVERGNAEIEPAPVFPLTLSGDVKRRDLTRQGGRNPVESPSKK